MIAILQVAAPTLVDEWLALPGLFRLLIASLAVLPIALFLQSGERGWRWAKEAEDSAPELMARRNWFATFVIVAVIGLVVLGAWIGALSGKH